MGHMRNFTTYLSEARWATEDKLTHLEHPEDHIIKSGEPGFHHAFNTLKSTAEFLQGFDNGTRVMTKFDGAPSVVFGHNPENGKFFVASKSAWNKNPKLNYTKADIQTNHGQSPGLVSKLNAALEHLPKVAPKRGVFQGDFLYNKADGDVQEDEKNYQFRPQLIGFTAPKDSEQGKKIAKSQIGFAVHTGYKGTTLSNLKADYTPDTLAFKDHKDVHLHTWDQSFDHVKAKYTPQEHEDFKQFMNAAGDQFKNSDRHHLFVASNNPDMQDHLTTYINKTVRTGDTPSFEGLKQHVADRFNKHIDSLKTEKGKEQKRQGLEQANTFLDKNQHNVKAMLKMQNHIQRAKNVLIDALNRGDSTGYKYDIQGNASKSEGFVTVVNNRPTKLIDRNEFSRLNSLHGKFQKK